MQRGTVVDVSRVSLGAPDSDGRNASTTDVKKSLGAYSSPSPICDWQ
jgi:hypothetical protein